MTDFELIDESINAYISTVHNAAYIRFDNFSLGTDITSRFLNFYNKVADYKNLIIDVRNNPGGRTFIWKNCIISLLATEDIRYDIYAAFNMGQNTSLYYNKWNPKLYKSTITEKDWIYHTPYFQDTVKQNMGPEDVIVKSTDTIKKDSKSINYKGKIWLLVDENSFSAADTISYFCKTTKFATIVGTKTKGNGITPIEESECFYSMPNTGIIIRYFPFMGFNVDGSSNVESGDAPDIYTNEDALKACLQEIKDGSF